MNQRNGNAAGGDLEIRSIGLAEIRAEPAGEDEGPILRGYAAVFNEWSVDLGGFRERIAPGAFSRTIADGDDVRALIDHDSSRVIGRTRANTLTIREDDRGLAVSIRPPDTNDGRDLVTLIERGDVSQMSFAFMTRNDDWEEMNGEIVRTLLDVQLFDVSAVTFPAYEQTGIDVAERSLEIWKQKRGGQDKPDDDRSELERMSRALRLTEAGGSVIID